MRSDELPPAWVERAVDVRLVPLLPGELGQILAGGSAVSMLEPEDVPLASLVARGLSTRQIADHLRLSPRTVQRHVARLQRRLGARTRSELATMLAQAGFG